MPPVSLLFDLDGVLVDTQPVEFSVLKDMYESLGVDLRWVKELEDSIRGVRMAEAVGLLHARAGKRPEVGVIESVRTEVEKRLTGKQIVIPGVEVALEQLTEYSKVVVSNSPLWMINNRLKTAGLLRWFSGHTVSAYEIGHWKPDPRIYLFAKSLVGGDSHCIAIEDSRVGVQSAIRAGVPTLWYTSEPNLQGLSRPFVRVFDRMEDLPSLVPTFLSAVETEGLLLNKTKSEVSHGA